MSSDILIVRPLNTMFFILLSIAVLIGIVFICIFKDKSDKTKRIAITVFYGIACIVLAFMPYFLYLDKDYAKICVEHGIPTFNILRQLPLHLCNFNVYFIFVSVWSKKRTFLAFSFFTATLGTIFPLLFPAVGFDGYSILLPRIFNHYFIHLAILLEMPFLYCLGLYKPRFKDIPKLLCFAIGLVMAATCFDLFLVKSGLCEGANYFFALSPEGNSLLSIFYSWIPIPGLYLLPGIGLGIALILVFTFFFNIKDITNRLTKNRQNSLSE